jgi:hypothetical protein
MKLTLSFFIACLVLPGVAWAAATAHPPASDQAAVVDANNAFAIDL